MKLHNFKTMTCQAGELVVWMSYLQDTPAPIVDATLINQTYYDTTDIDVWDAYKKYELYLNQTGHKLYVNSRNDLSPEQFERYKFLRAKCIAYDVANKTITRFYERHGMIPETTIYSKMNSDIPVTYEKWIPLYEQLYKCNAQQAKKVLLFKIKEYENLHDMLETIRLTIYHQLIETKTLQEVSDVYRSEEHTSELQSH